MNSFYVSYALWKTLADDAAHAAWPRYHYVRNGHYQIWIGTADRHFESSVTGTDKTHFDTNYLAGSIEVTEPDDAIVSLELSQIWFEPHDPNGIKRTAAAPFIVDESYSNNGYKFTTTPEGTKFFDVLVPTNIIYLQGGSFAVSAAAPADIHVDDYIEFSIIDIDNVLGYGPLTELKKYIRTHLFMPTDNGVRYDKHPGTLGIVYPGLYMRAAFTSHGTAAMTVNVWYDWFDT